MRMLMVVATLAALALVPQFAAAHEGAEVGIVGHTHPDGPIEIEGTDFEPGEVVQLELRKQGAPNVPLGRAPVGADGTFAITLHVPSDVEPGLFQVVAIAGNDTISADATILAVADEDAAGGGTAAGEDVSNERPAGETVGLAIATAVLALLGAVIILLDRRRAPKPLPGS